jgi:threonine dehydratase
MSQAANKSSSLLSVESVYQASVRLKGVAHHTPLMSNYNLSEEYSCNLLLKREDLQIVRSYKIRGAYNKMASMPAEELQSGVVCASAGNHAQGVAFACYNLGVEGTIYMPSTTPLQKVNKVRLFGKDKVKVVLEGDTFDVSYDLAIQDATLNKKIFVHPFDDPKVMEGQATVGLEILQDCPEEIDIVFIAIGGGGLASGLGSYFKRLSPRTRIIGIEPAGAAAMKAAFEAGEVVTLDHIDPFVDGAAVRRVGDYSFEICRNVVDEIATVPEGKVCSTILKLYNEEAIVVEPAGALTIAALDQFKKEIKGLNVVCVVSGGNNDITRTEEIKERSLLYEGLKHYFIIRFPQRAGALREFLSVLGDEDDITRFEYIKKNNRESGPALVGIVLKRKSDYSSLVQRMQDQRIQFQTLNDNPMLFDLLV